MAMMTKSDEAIKKDVVDHLYWDSRVDASDVMVEVLDGEVTLTGAVPTHIAYRAAEEDVWALSGVRRVVNKLDVQYPAGVSTPPDSEIQSRVENVLLWQHFIDFTEMEVDVDNGWVTLRGTVDAYWKKVRTEEVVLGVAGVLGVTNELAIVPTKDLDDKIIAEDITAALERNIHTDVDLIDVEVEDGTVTLSGSVPSLPAYRMAERIAENTFGVVMVINELVIR